MLSCLLGFIANSLTSDRIPRPLLFGGFDIRTSSDKICLLNESLKGVGSRYRTDRIPRPQCTIKSVDNDHPRDSE
jgi:hypothetical protein